MIKQITYTEASEEKPKEEVKKDEPQLGPFKANPDDPGVSTGELFNQLREQEAGFDNQLN